MKDLLTYHLPVVLCIHGNHEMRPWEVDIIISNSCPIKYEPIEVFLPGIAQSKVDKSTEEWLGTIESVTTYQA